ncbi:hypothetical protein QSH57_005049 [Fusarium oxysporum f. sp. vasinfectum]|nr:hypothetical protein QSH57_005049 [Fusarium oxysporum f. sp. vasinfectum]
MSGSGTQDSPIPLEQSTSIPQLNTSQSDSPHHDTAILAKDYAPFHWDPLADKAGHLSPVHSQQVQDPSSPRACRETTSGGHSTDSYEVVAAFDTELDEHRQTETSNATYSSPIANATSAWAETLEDRGSDSNRVPFYPGDRRGPAFVIDICKPQRLTKSNHAFVAMPSLESLLPEEIEYLRFKGCFSLPTHLLREALVKAYFHYAHPFEPVLDPEDFFNKYSKGHLSLLLLWSIFMCAANFVEDSLFAENCHETKFVFKHKAFQRAKVQTLDAPLISAQVDYANRLHRHSLYRPFLHETPHGVPVEEQDSWKAFAKNRVRTAAAHATHAVNCMMAEELIKFSQTIAVLTIGPPILVHLLDMTSSKSSSSQLAKHNLALCLLALDEMRKSYISADAAYKLFDRSRTMVEKRLRGAGVVSQDPTVSPETQVIETAQWLDDSEDYDFTSAGISSAFWTPFASVIPHDSFENSF